MGDGLADCKEEVRAGSEDAEEIEQDDDGDRDADQPEQDAAHGVTLVVVVTRG
jgi:hypothetical protein